MQRIPRMLFAVLAVLACMLTLVTSVSAHSTKSTHVVIPHYVQCQSTTQYNDIILDTDDYGPNYSQWILYYNIQRDSRTGAPCYVQAVVRIWPSPGHNDWCGSFYVQAEQSNGDLITRSYGTACTAPTHIVFRGSWFSVHSGTTYELAAYDTNYTYAIVLGSVSL